MTRPLTLHAEIFRGLYQTRAEELLPDAVYGHARSQRMFRIHQPHGQAQPVTRRTLGKRRQARGRATGHHNVSRLIVNAAGEHARLALGAVTHHHYFRETAAHVVDALFRGIRFRLQLAQLRIVQTIRLRDGLLHGRRALGRLGLQRCQQFTRSKAWLGGIGNRHAKPPQHVLLGAVVELQQHHQLRIRRQFDRLGQREHRGLGLLHALLPRPHAPAATGVAVNRLFHIKAALVKR